MSLPELLYGVLFDPSRTFRRISEEPSLFMPFIIFSLVNCAGILMSVLTLTLNDPTLRQMLSAFVPAGLLLLYVKWALSAGLLHLAAEYMGGHGSVKSLVAVYGVAGLPEILLIPVQALLLGFGFLQGIAGTVTALTGIAAYGWSVLLLVQGIKEVYGFSLRRALASVLVLPLMFVVIVIAVVLTLVLGAAAVFPIISN